MKRVLLIILLHLSLFFLVFVYQAQAEEDNEWYVNDFGTFVVAAVSGEVVHGDKLRFFIKKEDCSKVSMMFSNNCKQGIPSIRKEASRAIISASDELWETAVCCLQNHEIGIKVLDPTIHK